MLILFSNHNNNYSYYNYYYYRNNYYYNSNYYYNYSYFRVWDMSTGRKTICKRRHQARI